MLLPIAVFAAAKTVQLALLAAVPAQFDVSTRLLLARYAAEKAAYIQLFPPWLQRPVAFLIHRVLHRLVAWDAVYFADLFANGIVYEHQYVFCPLWWRAVRLLPGGFYPRLVASVLLANACHLAAAIVLYHYTRAVFASARVFAPAKMARVALVLFVLSPAAAFLTAPYSEPAAALASFGCLWAREVALAPRLARQKAAAREMRAPRWALYAASGALAALAFGLRANCLLLGLVYVYDVVALRHAARTRPAVLVAPLAAGALLGAAFVAAQVASYRAICPGGRGEWCAARVPSLYAYAQAHYWNNGFLRYWTPNNVPNFVFAAPTLALLALGTRYFLYTYPVQRAVPVLLVNAVFVVLLVLNWHVQIVTRIHTFLPNVYWFVAGLATQRSPSENRAARWCISYMLLWGVVQVALFGAFLPPA